MINTYRVSFMERLKRSKRGFGVLALCTLLALGFWNATSDSWEPPQKDVINVTNVTEILKHSIAYENLIVSFVSWIEAIDITPNNTILTFVGINGVLNALIVGPFEGYERGDSVAIKGRSYLLTRGYVLVDAIHPINHNIVIGFSILGGGIFVYYFFRTFTFGPSLSIKRRDL